MVGAEHAGEEPSPEAAAARAVQERLWAWAEKELLPLRVQQAERNAVLLGDGVYSLAWDPGKGRVRLAHLGPGPVLPGVAGGR